MIKIYKTIKGIINHPLNRANKINAIFRFINWQLSSRLKKNPIKVPFVNSTFLNVSRGMKGATGNIYSGLHEYEEMGFLLHFLRSDDAFIDIGSNIGSYSILASGVIGARSISIEPVPSTYNDMLSNIKINNLESKVYSYNIGLNNKKGHLMFSSDKDAENHVISDSSGSKNNNALKVKVDLLDTIAKDFSPNLIKIDVEGYEWLVIQGGIKTLSSKKLFAVILELNGNGIRYGFDDRTINNKMIELGFIASTYDPFNREIIPYPKNKWKFGNTIYFRNIELITDRIKESPCFTLSTGKII